MVANTLKLVAGTGLRTIRSNPEETACFENGGAPSGALSEFVCWLETLGEYHRTAAMNAARLAVES